MITAAEADALVAEAKVINDDVRWSFQRGGMRFAVRVRSLESDAELTLHGFVGRKNRSVVLVIDGAAIRRYTVHRSHRNPDTGRQIHGAHIHTWHDEWGGRIAMTPDDIRVGDPDQELFDCLRQFNITLRGRYEPLR